MSWLTGGGRGFEGHLIGICPNIQEAVLFVDVITCGDAYGFASDWPTRLRVLDQRRSQP